MPTFIRLTTISKMAKVLQEKNLPIEKSFGLYPDTKAAEQALISSGWKNDTTVGWHMPHLPTDERPYPFATIEEMPGELCDPQELPDGH